MKAPHLVSKFTVAKWLEENGFLEAANKWNIDAGIKCQFHNITLLPVVGYSVYYCPECKEKVMVSD